MYKTIKECYQNFFCLDLFHLTNTKHLTSMSYTLKLHIQHSCQFLIINLSFFFEFEIEKKNETKKFIIIVPTCSQYLACFYIVHPKLEEGEMHAWNTKQLNYSIQLFSSNLILPSISREIDRQKNCYFLTSYYSQKVSINLANKYIVYIAHLIHVLY